MSQIEAIYITPTAAAPLQSVPSARLIAGAGIEGDRYAAGVGTFSKNPLDHELTLMEAEVLETIAAEQGFVLPPAEMRRNLLTRGVRLNDLEGKRFRVGEALCIGTRLCPPCLHLERVTGLGGLTRLLTGRGGLRARVLRGGTVAVGDALILEGETA